MAKTKLKTKRSKENRFLKAFLLSLLVAVVMVAPKIILNNGTFNGAYSVLSYITPLSPYAAYFNGPVLILQFALCGLFSYSYIRRFVKNQDTAVIGSLLYTFSGFSLFNYTTFSLQIVMVFPLLLLGLELLVTEKTRGVFALFTLLTLIADPFMLPYIVAFLIIYFILRLLSADWQMTKSVFFSALLEFVLAVAMFCPILLPTLFSMASNLSLPTGWDALVYPVGQMYPNVLLSAFLPPAVGLSPNYFPLAPQLSLWLPLVSVIGVIGLSVSFKKHWLKRIIAVCLVGALVPVFNISFNWFFIPALMMSLCSGIAFDRRAEIDWWSSYRITFGATIIPLLCIGLIPNLSNGFALGIYDMKNGLQSYIGFWVNTAVSVLCLVIMGIVLSFAVAKGKSFIKITLTTVTLVCMAAGYYQVICSDAAALPAATPYDHIFSYEDHLMLWGMIGIAALMVLIIYVALCKGYIRRGGGRDTATYGAEVLASANKDEIPDESQLSEILSNIGDAPETNLFDK